MHRSIPLLILCLAVAAPSAQAADDYVVADQAPAAHGIRFVDQRPAKEIKGGLPLLFNPTYSVPDKRLTPGLLALLGSALESRADAAPGEREIVITRLQVQNYFAATYQRNQAISMAITSAASPYVLSRIEDGDAVDAVIFRCQGSVGGKPFAVKFARAYDPGSYNGMVYNGAGARAATRQVVEEGIGQTVEAIVRALAAD